MLIRPLDSSNSKATSTTLSASSAPKSPNNRGPRTPRTPRKVEVQATRLEALDDSLDPLGPLGESATLQPDPAPVPAPTPPSKEQSLLNRNVRPTSSAASSRMSSSMMDSVDLNDDVQVQVSRARHPPPVQPPPSGIENQRRQNQPSVSVEQAAKPSFDITVGDPHKVGDLTSSHIVYQVRTSVSCSIGRLLATSLIDGDQLDNFKSLQTNRIRC